MRSFITNAYRHCETISAYAPNPTDLAKPRIAIVKIYRGKKKAKLATLYKAEEQGKVSTHKDTKSRNSHWVLGLISYQQVVQLCISWCYGAI